MGIVQIFLVFMVINLEDIFCQVRTVAYIFLKHNFVQIDFGELQVPDVQVD